MKCHYAVLKPHGPLWAVQQGMQGVAFVPELEHTSLWRDEHQGKLSERPH